MNTIRAVDAEERMSELLDRVEQGEEILILRNGKPVARMVAAAAPAAQPADKASADELVAIGREFSTLVQGNFSSADLGRILYDDEGLPK